MLADSFGKRGEWLLAQLGLAFLHLLPHTPSAGCFKRQQHWLVSVPFFGYIEKVCASEYSQGLLLCKATASAPLHCPSWPCVEDPHFPRRPGSVMLHSLDWAVSLSGQGSVSLHSFGWDVSHLLFLSQFPLPSGLVQPQWPRHCSQRNYHLQQPQKHRKEEEKKQHLEFKGNHVQSQWPHHCSQRDYNLQQS